MHKIVERQDTPEVRGAIAKIPHLVTVVDQSIKPVCRTKGPGRARAQPGLFCDNFVYGSARRPFYHMIGEPPVSARTSQQRTPQRGVRKRKRVHYEA